MVLKVLSVASEAVPLVKTGGLADVVGALPAALEPHGAEMTTLLPGYPSVLKGLRKTKPLHEWDTLFGEPARLLSGKLHGHPLIVLDAPGFFARGGTPYGDASGKDWPDNWRRFAALARAAATLAGGGVKGRRFDLLHAHDWQAALAPAFLRYDRSSVPSVLTIHNMAFQGWFDRAVFSGLGLPKEAWSVDGVEYHGGVGFLKAGLTSASAITTVSPSYAAEIRTPEFGMGLEGLIFARGDRVRGILNGIDIAEWNPSTDQAIASNFAAKSISRRAANKVALETEFGLDSDNGPLFIVVSRLTWQKGMDLLPQVLDHIVGNGARLVILGSGDAEIERALHLGAKPHSGRTAVRIGYDEDLSHRMQAGGDAILIPSRFEPCGLTQLYGLAYGCVPVVARTGGLADTVIDANVAGLAAGVATGVQFTGVTRESLATAISRTIAIYRDPAAWRMIQRNGMRADFSWARSGRAYADLYRELAGTA
jgi:starch synthase